MTIKKYRSKQYIEVWQFDGTQENIPEWLKDKVEFLMMRNGNTDIFEPCLYFDTYTYNYTGTYFIKFNDTGIIKIIWHSQIQEFLKDFEAI